jgi:hypothetical protein
MTSRQGEAVQAQPLLGDSWSVTLIAFVPFLTRGFSPDSGSGFPQDASGSGGGAPSLGALIEELHLWGYSQDVNERIRMHMPHRVFARAGDHAAIDVVAFDGCSWREDSSRVEFWDVEVGLVSLVYHLDSVKNVGWSQVRASVGNKDSKRAILNRAAELIDAYSASSSARPAADGSYSFEPATPLWVQEMIVVEPHDHQSPALLDGIASQLTGQGARLDPGEHSGGYSLRLGIEACVVGNPDAGELRDALGRVVATQTVVWAAAIDFDFRLWRLLRVDGAPSRYLPLEAVQNKSLELLDVFERVQRFRMDVEIIPLHLADPDRPIWECVNERWGLNRQLASLDAKLNAVEHVYEHLTNIMTAAQARFLNEVVLAITMLSLATFFLTVWEFTQKRFDPFEMISAAVVLTAVIFSALLFYAIRWWGGRATTEALRRRLR